jgi:hypothetical protein
MRICRTTGLGLVGGPSSAAFRIARSPYGPLDPPERHEGPEGAQDSLGWSRFDTPGRTVYATDDRLTAFMELLAPYRCEVDATRRALQKDADAMGIPLHEYWTMIIEDWDQAGTMRARWLPRAWREGRSLYRLAFPEGSWVDITSTHTLSALSLSLADRLVDLGVDGGLTVAHVTGDDRLLTTTIAGWLREIVTLDDGTQPLGVRFTSKHGRPPEGTGTCWAFWLRAQDAGLPSDASVLGAEDIAEDDPDLVLAQQLCGIQTR